MENYKETSPPKFWNSFSNKLSNAIVNGALFEGILIGAILSVVLMLLCGAPDSETSYTILASLIGACFTLLIKDKI